MPGKLRSIDRFEQFSQFRACKRIRASPNDCLKVSRKPAKAKGSALRQWQSYLLVPADGTLVSDPYRQGCHEDLTVLEGALEVTAGEEVARVGKGNTIRSAAAPR